MLIKTKKQDKILIVISTANTPSYNLEDAVREVRFLIGDEESPTECMPFHRGFGRSSYHVAKYLNGIKSKYKCFVFVGNVSLALRIAVFNHKVDLECYFVGKAPYYDPDKGFSGEDEWALIGHILPKTVD